MNYTASSDCLLDFNYPGNWHDGGENKQYMNHCCDCGKPFIGHKRRLICRVCAEACERRAQEEPKP